MLKVIQILGILGGAGGIITGWVFVINSWIDPSSGIARVIGGPHFLIFGISIDLNWSMLVGIAMIIIGITGLVGGIVAGKDLLLAAKLLGISGAIATLSILPVFLVWPILLLAAALLATYRYVKIETTQIPDEN